MVILILVKLLPQTGITRGAEKLYLNIQDIRQLSLRLDNLRLKERQNAWPKAQHTKLLDNIHNRRHRLYEWLDKILWPQSKQMQSLVQ